MTNTNVLLAIFACCAIMLFYYGIYLAIKLSFKPNGSFPSFLNTTVTSISAILATNLGSVLGIQALQVSTGSKATFFDMGSNLTQNFLSTSSLMWVAAYLYLAGLIATMISWIILKFDEQTVIPLIPNLSKSLVGVILGALAILLGVHQ